MGIPHSFLQHRLKEKSNLGIRGHLEHNNLPTALLVLLVYFSSLTLTSPKTYNCVLNNKPLTPFFFTSVTQFFIVVRQNGKSLNIAHVTDVKMCMFIFFHSIV